MTITERWPRCTDQYTDRRFERAIGMILGCLPIITQTLLLLSLPCEHTHTQGTVGEINSEQTSSMGTTHHIHRAH